MWFTFLLFWHSTEHDWVNISGSWTQIQIGLVRLRLIEFENRIFRLGGHRFQITQTHAARFAEKVSVKKSLPEPRPKINDMNILSYWNEHSFILKRTFFHIETNSLIKYSFRDIIWTALNRRSPLSYLRRVFSSIWIFFLIFRGSFKPFLKVIPRLINALSKPCSKKALTYEEPLRYDQRITVGL